MGLADPPAPVTTVAIFHALGERVLDVRRDREIPNFFVSRDLVHDVLQIVDPVFRQSVFTRRDFHRIARPGEIQVIRFDTSRFAIRTRIGVTERNRSALASLAITVRCSSVMNVSSSRV